MKARIIKTGEMVDVYHEAQHGQITNIYKESVLVNGRMWTEDELDFCVKANEAPEKIYLQENTTTDCYGEFWPEWFESRAKDSDIEYTRTDAFIEKACSWLENNLRGIVGGSIYMEDFRKYMEGE